MQMRSNHLFKSIAYLVEFTGLPDFICRNVKREIPSRFRSYLDYAVYEYNHGKDMCCRLEKIHFKPGKYELDIGCGLGGGTVAQAEASQETVVIGLDVNRDYLKIAREMGKSHDNLCFVLGDAHNLCFKDESIDSVISIDTFEHLKNPDACLKEIKRILKSTGCAYIRFPLFWGPFGGHLYVHLPFPWVHYLPKRVIKRMLRSTPNCGWLNAKAEYEQFVELNRWSTKELIQAILKSGFRINQQREVSYAFFRKFSKHLTGRLRDFFGAGYCCLLVKD